MTKHEWERSRTKRLLEEMNLAVKNSNDMILLREAINRMEGEYDALARDLAVNEEQIALIKSETFDDALSDFAFDEGK